MKEASVMVLLFFCIFFYLRNAITTRKEGFKIISASDHFKINILIMPVRGE